MPVKYIRPNNLITDRKTTKLVKQKKFISENEYEMKVSVIQELLKELNLENFQIDENIKNDYENFSKIRDEVSDKIEDIINYIDELKNNEDYDIEQIKAIVKEKIEKEIYERYKIYSNTNSKYIYKNLIVKNMNKHISNIEYNEIEKINIEKYKRINTFENILLSNEDEYIINNIKDGDFIISYNEYERKVENIDEFCIEDNSDINTDNKNVKKYSFNGKLNENCILKTYVKFINDIDTFKIVSIKKQCTKMSFYYKTNSNGYYNLIYLYIDGIFKGKYYNNSWTQAVINDLTDEEHEFTWVLYSYSNEYYSYIRTIAFNDIVETDTSLFNNTYEKELKNINNNINDDYKHGSSSTTPFYNDAIGIKIVSIKKQCTKMSFYYKVGNSNYRYIFLYIDGVYKDRYINTSWTQIEINNLTDEEHEFTWVLYSGGSSYYSCIDTIAFNDIVETDSSLFSNNGNIPLADVPIGSTFINSTNSSTPFYNDINFKIVSIKKQCTKMSFYYKTSSSDSYYNSIYLYIDGVYKDNYYNNTSWTQIEINNLIDEEHEFTWVFYSASSDRYSCIDTIAFNDIVETDSSKFSNIYEKELKNIKKYINDTNSTTPFYNNTEGIKIVSIKKRCTKMSFYYKTYSGHMYLYIDGVYKERYSNTSWTQAVIDNLTGEEHEFTWVLYNDSNSDYSCIDTIAFNDIVETDSSKFNNIYEKELRKIKYKNGLLSTTPFYNFLYGIKIVSIKKQCTKMSFYYKTLYYTAGNYSYYSLIYLYIDGIYKERYSNSSWTQAVIDNLTGEEHEFTWVLYNYNSDSYSCVDTIAFNDILETDSSLFSNNGKIPLADIPLADISTDRIYINDTNSSTPFYNNTTGIKIVSIKKRCTKMSFYIKTSSSNSYYSLIYLYIDGVYKNSYNDISWSQVVRYNLTNEEHEFTWVLYSYSNSYYSCIDTIAFNDIVETDSSLFNNNGKIPLADIPTDSDYINDTNSSTPFYNNTTGIKIVSIKKRCTKMNFYYKAYSSSFISFYIDGVYKELYNNSTSWTQAVIDDLTDEEHEFTWVLYSYISDNYSCIDTIAFNDIVETDSSKFNNKANIPLAEIPTGSTFINGTNSSTPFYNNINFKIVSIKKQCTKMSFYYKTKNSDYDDNSIYLYIDGVYKNSYNDISWSQAVIDDLTNEEHEFTWVLYSYSDSYYSCIDTIAFNDIVFSYYIEENSSIDDLKDDIDVIENKELIYLLENNKFYNIKINNFDIKKVFSYKNNTIFYIINDDNIYIIDNLYFLNYFIKINNIKNFKLFIYYEDLDNEKIYFKINDYDINTNKNKMNINGNDYKKIEIFDNSKEIEVYKKLE